MGSTGKKLCTSTCRVQRVRFNEINFSPFNLSALQSDGAIFSGAIRERLASGKLWTLQLAEIARWFGALIILRPNWESEGDRERVNPRSPQVFHSASQLHQLKYMQLRSHDIEIRSGPISCGRTHSRVHSTSARKRPHIGSNWTAKRTRIRSIVSCVGTRCKLCVSQNVNWQRMFGNTLIVQDVMFFNWN